MRHQPSYLNLKIFHFKGAHTEVLADAKVDDLLDDPLITFHTKSTVDLDALAKTFPLQESVPPFYFEEAGYRAHEVGRQT